MQLDTVRTIRSVCIISALALLAGCVPGSPARSSYCIYGDCLNGKGIRRDDRGLYVGEWSKGQQNGTGAEYSGFGERYYGGWHNGVREGRGDLSIATGVISGMWAGGVPDGVMTYAGKDGSFTGRLEKGGGRLPYLFPKEGEVVWPSGDRYRGEFGCVRGLCGVPEGAGELHLSSGEIIKGSFATSAYTILTPHYVTKVETATGTTRYSLDPKEDFSIITFRFKDLHKGS